MIILDEFTMASQPIRLILVDWLYSKRKRSVFVDIVFHFFWRSSSIFLGLSSIFVRSSSIFLGHLPFFLRSSYIFLSRLSSIFVEVIFHFYGEVVFHFFIFFLGHLHLFFFRSSFFLLLEDVFHFFLGCHSSW
jgi:hypothetical protein